MSKFIKFSGVMVIPLLLILLAQNIGRAQRGAVLVYIASDSGIQRLLLLDMQTGITQRFYGGSSGVTALSFAITSDGQRIAVLASSAGGFDTYIAILDLAGRELTRISNPYAYFSAPLWFSDGETLLIVVYGTTTQIYSVNIAAPNDWTPLPHQPEIHEQFFDMQMSADGQRVLFRSGSDEICIMNSDGGRRRCLTQFAYTPVWAPGGESITFTRYDAQGRPRLYLRALDSAIEAPLAVTAELQAFDAAWSPNGRALAFIAAYDLWQVNADGTGLRRLTATPLIDETMPRWLP
ncbi:MAG: hypothetical protein HXY40_16690 [Chloroflexi bacterium]|nr:hypothetical protein [Chloroflexota bacterium]